MSTETTDTPRVSEPKRKLTDIRVTAEPPRWAEEHSRDLEEQARNLEAWAKDLNEFVRDHRSHGVIVRVERVIETVCSVCESRWETYVEEGELLCAHCGARTGEGVQP